MVLINHKDDKFLEEWADEIWGIIHNEIYRINQDRPENEKIEILDSEIGLIAEKLVKKLGLVYLGDFTRFSCLFNQLQKVEK